MVRLSRPGLAALLLVTLLMGSCSKEESGPQASPEDAGAAKKRKQAKKEEAAAAAGPAEISGPLPPVTAPAAIPLRPGAPTVLAQFTGGVLVPMATRRGNTWEVEEVQTLDRMPEGAHGKDAAPEVLVNWWKRLDVAVDDTFLLRGDHGAEGGLKARHEFATADRGGCVGLAWAVPGEVQWTVKPGGPIQGSGVSGQAEHVWALRGAFSPRSSKPSRELTKEELKAGAQALERVREALKQSLPALPEGASWQSCDSISEPTCKADRAHLVVMDLEGDGQLEAMATLQLRPVAEASKSTGGAHPVESRVLLGFTPQGVRLLGRWDSDPRKSGEEGQAPIFSGVIDITGDGRAELIFRRVANETENWEAFQAIADKPGEWTSLFKTQNEGC